MTCLGTCVPAGPSRKAEPWRWYCKLSEGNCSLTHAISNALFVPCIAGVLIFVCSRKPARFSELLVSHTFRGHCRGALQRDLLFSEATCMIRTVPQFSFVKYARGIQIGSTFLTTRVPATRDVPAGRGSISEVVPHSCRFGAGYKSNERPPIGRLRAMLLHEVLCARSYSADRAHACFARIAARRLRPRNHR